MDLLKRAQDMIKEKGLATIIAIVVVSATLIAGAMIGKYATTKDSIAEETIEAILLHHGIDCEFSPDDEKQ